MDYKIEMLIKHYENAKRPAPKSTRLLKAFIKMIENSYWVKDQKLPTETQLAEMLPVGLTTIQNALGRLGSKGYIRRIKKKGSFVNALADQHRKFAYFQYVDDEENLLSNEDVEFEIEKIDTQGAWSDFLGRSNHYIRVKRLMKIDGNLLVHNCLYVHYEEFSFLLDSKPDDFKNISFKSYFEDRLGLEPKHSKRYFSYVKLTASQQKLLSCRDQEIGVVYRVKQYDQFQKPLLYIETLTPINDYQLRILCH